jgi:hypothetical protein
LILTSLSVISLCTGCRTITDVRQARGTGISRIFETPMDKVWDAIPEALISLGLNPVWSKKEDGYFLAERGVTAWSYGEKVAIFVEQAAPSRTKVEVVSKRTFALNISASDWEKRLLDKIEEALRKIGS